MGTQDKQIQLKNYNRRSVLNYIRKNKTATKAGLAAATGLTFMAIKKILEELGELQLIKYADVEKAGLGRHAIAYAINEVYKYTVGVHINKHATSIALMDLKGKIIALDRYEEDRVFQSQSVFIDKIIESIEKVIADARIEKKDVLGIGIGVPGPIDIEHRVILTPPNMPLLNYLPIADVLESKLGYQVHLYKDTNAIAFGEYWYGERMDKTNLIYIDVDMGIGSGSIINGQINVGANGIAGEFGHITIDLNGPVCNCGNRGCLEAMSSGLAVLRQLSEQLDKEPEHPLYEKRNHLEIEDVFGMAEKKDLLTLSILNRSAHYTGVAVGNLINILDPDAIVMGGILIQNYSQYFSIVQSVAEARKVKGAKKDVMSVSALKENAGVIGAGEIVADYFFNQTINEVFLKNTGNSEPSQ